MCMCWMSSSGCPHGHLFLRVDHLHKASIRKEDTFVLGDTRAQREGLPFLNPRFDPLP